MSPSITGISRQHQLAQKETPISNNLVVLDILADSWFNDWLGADCQQWWAKNGVYTTTRQL